jgi:hypothetical protein
MPDPYIIVAGAMLGGAIYGFGFMAGRAHERRRVRFEIERLIRLRREKLIP